MGRESSSELTDPRDELQAVVPDDLLSASSSSEEDRHLMEELSDEAALSGIGPARSLSPAGVGPATLAVGSSRDDDILVLFRLHVALTSSGGIG